jgi:hypothetical protein
MKSLREIALALALMVPMADGAAAAEALMSGQMLHERCQSPELVGQAMCLGYALEVVDGNASILRCAPRPLKVLKIVDAVKLHLKRYPADRDFPSQLIVRLALGKAWPCGK